MSEAVLARPKRPITGRFVLICILSFFGVIVAVNVVMARFAVTTFGGLETASSYQAGLAFRGEEMAAGQQAERHWQVQAKVGNAAGGGRSLVVQASDAAGQPLMKLEGTARLAHPANARFDTTVQLSPLGNGSYVATLDAPAGQWDLVIDLTQGGERMFRSKNRVILH